MQQIDYIYARKTDSTTCCEDAIKNYKKAQLLYKGPKNPLDIPGDRAKIRKVEFTEAKLYISKAEILRTIAKSWEDNAGPESSFAYYQRSSAMLDEALDCCPLIYSQQRETTKYDYKTAIVFWENASILYSTIGDQLKESSVNYLLIDRLNRKAKMMIKEAKESENDDGSLCTVS